MELKCPTIDDIKKRYEYKLEPNNFIDSAVVIYCMSSGRFEISFEKYKFDERIEELKKIINKKRDKIKKNILEEYEKTLNEISDGCKKIIEKVRHDYEEHTDILGRITYDYKVNRDKPGVEDVYLKIGKDIIDKEIKLFIHYHKILIAYNDHIINIKKNLIN